MVIVGCTMEVQFIKQQKEVEAPELRDSWEKFIKRQENKNAEQGK